MTTDVPALQLHDGRGPGLDVVDVGLAQGVADVLPRVLGVGPAGAQREADAAIAVRGDVLAVVRGAEDVEARRHRAVQEIRLGEAEVDQGAQGAERQAEPQLLALAEQVALLDRDVAQDARRRRDSRRRTRFRRCSARPPGPRGWSCPAPSPGCAEMSTFSKKPRLRRRCWLRRTLAVDEGVALGQPELAADHLVQRARVAGDVDALDVDARAFLDVEGDVDGRGCPCCAGCWGGPRRRRSPASRRRRTAPSPSSRPRRRRTSRPPTWSGSSAARRHRGPGSGSTPRPCRTCSARPR